MTRRKAGPARAGVNKLSHELREFRAGRFCFMLDRRAPGVLYVDAFVDGRDTSVFSIRLDDDEGTVTVYDPRADEGETVYQTTGTVDTSDRVPLEYWKAVQAPPAWVPRVGGRALYTDWLGGRHAGTVTGRGEKNGRPVFDFKPDPQADLDGDRWGYADQFSPENAR